MGNDHVSTVPTISADLLERYAATPSSWATDGLGRLGLGSWMDDVVPLSPGWRVHGRIRTLKFVPRAGIKRPLSIYTIIRSFEPGDVLVIATGGTRSWLFGENIAHLALYQGLKGMVTDGRVRDAGELKEMDIPIFSRGVSARPPGDLELAAVDVPVECGGAQVRPGDLLIGDIDGIVVVPNQAIEPLITEVEDLAALEKRQEEAIEARASLADIQAVLAAKKQRKGGPVEIVERS
jgi:regulator of RNase E activity RraA